MRAFQAIGGLTMIETPTERHWRCAFQIAPQLPPDHEEAWAVLGLLAMLMGMAYTRPQPQPPAPDGSQLLLFPGGGSKTPRRRASSSGNPSALSK